MTIRPTSSSTSAAAELWPFDPARPVQWTAVASGEARVDLSGSGRPGQDPLRLDYDFGAGTGFVVARTEVAVALPEHWEMRLLVRGDSPANGLEVKLADAAGTSVWRWKREVFEPAAEWSEVRLRGHEFEFAWGPGGGGAPAFAGAVEIAVIAVPGGRGWLEVSQLRVLDLGALGFASLHASSCAPGSAAAMAVDGDAATAWRSAAGDAAPALELEFADQRDLGGLVVQWQGGPRAFRVETRGAGVAWSVQYAADPAGAEVSFVPLAVLDARALRLVGEGDGVAIAGLALKPYGWARTPSEFLTNVASASPRGQWPRYLLREQSLWTPVASPDSGPVGLLGEDGAVEVGEGGFTLEPSLMVAADAAAPRWRTWADVERRVLLEDAPLPVPTVRWLDGNVELDVTAVAEDAARVLVRYRVRNNAAEPLRATLFVSLRPLQGTPPWQAWQGLGGPSAVDSIRAEGGIVRLAAGARSAWLVASPPPSAFGAAGFDAGGLAPWLARGLVPAASSASDARGLTEAALSFPLTLAPSSFADVYVACSAMADGDGAAVQAGDGAARVAAATEAWRAALPMRDAFPAAPPAFDVATTAVAHVLACRDGAALQPGPRRYTRSWIRDGAIMAAALARAGRCDAASAFVEWYAPFQRDDGFVPCCVDHDGADPLVEHDSHGQLIHAVAETYRFTRDREFARRMWPRCVRAAAFVEHLRDTRRAAEFAEGDRRACFGLLPESVSHEGYLAQPVHSYWDDFWALRGYRDTAFLARELGFAQDEAHWSACAEDLGAAMARSIRLVMQEHGLATVPSSVEWADFDPTSIAGAVSLTGGSEHFPADALEKTFDVYMEGFRARRDPSRPWNNYSPYEARIVGALVRLGRRDDANEVLDALLADCRPRAWNQWPEILWRDAAAPAHVGDLPHCWIGAEYFVALRSMVVFEREADGALVVGAGLRRAWLDAGFVAKGLPTWFGLLDLEIRPDGRGGYRVLAGGAAAPPGGVVAALPGGAVVEVARG